LGEGQHSGKAQLWQKKDSDSQILVLENSLQHQPRIGTRLRIVSDNHWMPWEKLVVAFFHAA